MAGDPKKLKAVKQIGRKDILFCMARTPQTQRLVFGGSDFQVHEIDLAEEKPEPRSLEGHGSYVMGCALAGDRIVTGGYDRQLIWWDSAMSKLIRKVDAHGRWIRGVVASPDEKLIASVADDMVCRLWDAESGKLVRELRGHQEKTPHHYPSMLYACTFSRDGRYLATGDRVGHVVVWDVKSGKQVKTLEAPGNYTWDPRQRRHSIGGIRSLTFSGDGKLLAVGGIGKIGNIDHLGAKARVEIFDWEKGERITLFEDGGKGLAEHMAFERSGRWLAVAGGDHGGFVMFIEPTTGKLITNEKAPMHVHEFCLNETEDEIFGVGHGKIVHWKMG